MTLDPEICWRAVATRDRRFDGRFFSAVTSTGIYCRPICPVRTPRRENLRFYASAAAAEEAGFRACMRCRPEVAPGTPAWSGTSTTVARAMRLIDEGALDERSLDELAGRLGVGSRHLRRLFAAQLGASPLAVAQTRRAHFARTMIETTALPMMEIAHVAGFASLRRFNATIRQKFGRSPSELRIGRAREDAPMSLLVAARAPFDAAGVLAFLRARTIAGIDAAGHSSWERTCRAGDRAGLVRIEAGERGLALTVDDALVRDLRPIVERARRMFDVDADAEQIGRHLSKDPLLRRLVRRRPGVRIAGAWDPFEVCVRAIVGQQVSVAAATTIVGRIVQKFGPNGGASGTVFFPEPATLADATLDGLGMPGRRAETIRALSRAVANGALPLDGSHPLEETVAALVALPGIGAWTAQYIALRALSEPDAFPAGDLGLRKAAGGGAPISEKELLRRAESWRPWRGYAAMLLWGSLT